MAHPGLVIEQYVYHFLNQWHVGLQPSLTLNAKPNGEIAISLNLTTYLPANINEEQCSKSLSRNSGRGSRQRRRARRAVARSPRDEARNSFHVDNEENPSTTIENSPADATSTLQLQLQP